MTETEFVMRCAMAAMPGFMRLVDRNLPDLKGDDYDAEVARRSFNLGYEMGLELKRWQAEKML